MRPSWDEYFFSIAKVVATRATCPRRSVGAVLVFENNVIGMGYNGSPGGEPHCTDLGCLMVEGHCKRAVHAEVNALWHMSLLTEKPFPSDEVTLYCTLEPCRNCREILQDRLPKIQFKWIEDYE